MKVLDSALEKEYGASEAQLGNQRDPLREAVFILLSFQTDTRRAQQVWRRINCAFASWGEVERAPTRSLERILRPGGLHHQKARTLKSLLKAVRTRYGVHSLDSLRRLNDVDAEKALLRLPGISWKAARCILMYSLDRLTFPIDSNTFRIFKRTGIISHSAVYRRKTTHDQLQALIPARRRRPFHVNLVIHGQRVCRPRDARCQSCVVRSVCQMKLDPAPGDAKPRLFAI